jgi:L-glyceraldehyde 3-phosphate reductase
MSYVPAADRYASMAYRRCGRSGLRLPPISFGLWQNFGGSRPIETSREIVHRAFDLGELGCRQAARGVTTFVDTDAQSC